MAAFGPEVDNRPLAISRPRCERLEPMSPTPATAFDNLPLPPATLENLRRLGYHEMTAIQSASLPDALLGKDLIAQAKTGSGKTAAFALALLANLNVRRFAVQSLVLC